MNEQIEALINLLMHCLEEGKSNIAFNVFISDNEEDDEFKEMLDNMGLGSNEEEDDYGDNELEGEPLPPPGLMRIVEKSRVQQIQMQLNFLMDYIDEEHPKLYRAILSRVEVSTNGEMLMSMREDGFDYYQEHKEELYDAIFTKTGCHYLHLHVLDLGIFVQTEREVIIRNVGQFLPFGLYRPPTDEQEPNQIMNKENNKEGKGSDSLLSLINGEEEVMNIGEFTEALPEYLRDIKLSMDDIAAISTIIYQRSALGLLNTVAAHSRKEG